MHERPYFGLSKSLLSTATMTPDIGTPNILEDWTGFKGWTFLYGQFVDRGDTIASWALFETCFFVVINLGNVCMQIFSNSVNPGLAINVSSAPSEAITSTLHISRPVILNHCSAFIPCWNESTARCGDENYIFNTAKRARGNIILVNFRGSV